MNEKRRIRRSTGLVRRVVVALALRRVLTCRPMLGWRPWLWLDDQCSTRVSQLPVPGEWPFHFGLVYSLVQVIAQELSLTVSSWRLCQTRHMFIYYCLWVPIQTSFRRTSSCIATPTSVLPTKLMDAALASDSGIPMRSRLAPPSTGAFEPWVRKSFCSGPGSFRSPQPKSHIHITSVNFVAVPRSLILVRNIEH